jgi:hypothetical protein
VKCFASGKLTTAIRNQTRFDEGQNLKHICICTCVLVLLSSKSLEIQEKGVDLCDSGSINKPNDNKYTMKRAPRLMRKFRGHLMMFLSQWMELGKISCSQILE